MVADGASRVEYRLLGPVEVWLDGRRVEGNVVPLVDDGRPHEVRVVMG